MIIVFECPLYIVLFYTLRHPFYLVNMSFALVDRDGTDILLLDSNWLLLHGLHSSWKMGAYVVGLLVPLVFIILLRNSRKKRGLPVDVGGEPGYAIRNHRFTSPVTTAWEGIATLADLFEQS